MATMLRSVAPALAASLAVLLLPVAAFAQEAPPAPQDPLPQLPPAAPAPGYGQAPAAPQQPPAPGQAAPPGYAQQPPPGYAPYGQPPPGYAPYGQPPPGYAPYGQPPPGYTAPRRPAAAQAAQDDDEAPPPPPRRRAARSTEDDPPPPPKPRSDGPSWSVRTDIIDLIFGTGNLQIEYAVAGPLTVEIQPHYIYGAYGAKNAGLDVSGGGVAFEAGVWFEGRPFRGYFLKGHLETDSVKYSSGVDSITVPQFIYGAKFGSQSLLGGFFAVQYSIGIGFDSKHADRSVVNDKGESVTIPDPSPLGNGMILLGGLALGASF